MDDDLGGDTFRVGKYRGRTFVDVAEDDPGYLVWAYENMQHHHGIPFKLYREAQLDDEEENNGYE